MKPMAELTTLLIKVPRGNEYTPEAAQTFLSALTQINTISFWDRMSGQRPDPLALEIYLINQQIHFAVTTSSDLAPFVEAQLQSNYPLVLSQKVADPITNPIPVRALKLARGNYYPLATYSTFVDSDPLSSILSVMSKSTAEEFAVVQFALTAISGSWQTNTQKMLERGIKDREGNVSPLPDAGIIKEKISFPGFGVSIRIASTNGALLSDLTSAFGVFNKTDGNALSTRGKKFLARDHSFESLVLRRVDTNDILNIHEIATLWHLPGEKIKVPSISWGNAVLSETPENLPVSLGMDEDERERVNFFGRAQHKN